MRSAGSENPSPVMSAEFDSIARLLVSELELDLCISRVLPKTPQSRDRPEISGFRTGAVKKAPYKRNPSASLT
jgi:hypothetical protein